MKKYVRIDEKTGRCLDIGEGSDIHFYKSIGFTEQEVEQSDVDGNWYLAGFAPMKTAEEKAQEEAERIAMLKLTRGDVFRALLLAKGITREQLRSQLEVMPASTQEETVKRELALIDFDEALDFYRGNPLIDTVGLALGLTKEQLDRFFETNDYKELITANPQG